MELCGSLRVKEIDAIYRRNQMGRALSKRYFGNTNAGGVGGQGLLSVALGTAGSGYTQGLSATVAAPQLTGGIQSLVTVAVTVGTGAIASYTVTTAGSGYTSAPAITLVPPPAATSTYVSGSGTSTIVVTVTTNTIYVGMQISGTGTSLQTVTGIVLVGASATLTMSASTIISGTATFTAIGSSGAAGTVTLTTSLLPAIKATALTLGTTPRANSDIVKQVNTRSYKVTNQDATNVICKLVTATPAAVGEMAINATDSAGGTYWVTKLTKHRVTLTPNTGTQFVANASASWGNSVGDITAVAVINVSVILDQN